MFHDWFREGTRRVVGARASAVAARGDVDTPGWDDDETIETVFTQKSGERLYAAGELGSIWGFMYQSGGNLGECLAFGRIAGLNAAQEKATG